MCVEPLDRACSQYLLLPELQQDASCLPRHRAWFGPRSGGAAEQVHRPAVLSPGGLEDVPSPPGGGARAAPVRALQATAAASSAERAARIAWKTCKRNAGVLTLAALASQKLCLDEGRVVVAALCVNMWRNWSHDQL